MKSEVPEKIFAHYLDRSGISYMRNYRVTGGEVDFFVEKAGVKVFCDVKEVHDPAVNSHGRIEADGHIRSDINKFRRKFRKGRPEYPLVLVTMNFSSKFFTGVTVARALLGNIGVTFDRDSRSITSPLHHLPRGNAALTEQHGRSVAGVLVFDDGGDPHTLFLSPFTDKPVSPDFFPNVRAINLDRASIDSGITDLSKIMFWPRNIKGET